MVYSKNGILYGKENGQFPTILLNNRDEFYKLSGKKKTDTKSTYCIITFIKQAKLINATGREGMVRKFYKVTILINYTYWVKKKFPTE